MERIIRRVTPAPPARPLKRLRVAAYARVSMDKDTMFHSLSTQVSYYNAYIQRGILTASGDNFVDYHDCFDWFRRLVEEFEILPLQIGYDRYSAQYLVQEMEAYGFHMDDVYQGENLYPVIQEMQGLLEDGNIHIGDNDLLKMHLLNSAIKMSNERGRGKLVKVNSTLHIDGCAALLDALTVRQKWYGEIGTQLRN